MKISIAQIKQVKGDIAANINMHYEWIYHAVSSGANAIFFPELSITGYEPVLAKNLATTQCDERFANFQQISDDHKITIGIGAPIKVFDGIQISMIVFQPGKERQTYCKQQLHSDEYPYFIAGNYQMIITVGDTTIAPAICFESLQNNHSKNAKKLGAEIYIASVAKSAAGIKKAYAHFPEVSAKYAMPVLMANCLGHCDNFEGAGNSAVWNKEGQLIERINEQQEGLLIFDTTSESIIESIG